jgi:hypothetical protein
MLGPTCLGLFHFDIFHRHRMTVAASQPTDFQRSMNSGVTPEQQSRPPTFYSEGKQSGTACEGLGLHSPALLVDYEMKICNGFLTVCNSLTKHTHITYIWCLDGSFIPRLFYYIKPSNLSWPVFLDSRHRTVQFKYWCENKNNKSLRSSKEAQSKFPNKFLPKFY